MKTIVLSNSDLNGGAPIAAHRTHRALLACGVDSTMHVNRKVSDDWTVQSPHTGTSGLLNRLRPMLGASIPGLLYKERGETERSLNWLPSRWPQFINSSDADIVHLHWVNSEMLSLRDISRINKPMIMTMHDMWSFCGTEHYTEDFRYVDGYASNERSATLSGFDIDRWNWKRKRQLWAGKPWQVVAISRWLANCASDSELFRDWPISVIPNPVDTTVWKPLSKSEARRAFNLPSDKKILTFGALGGTSNPRKGYLLLEEALAKLAREYDFNNIHVAVFGQGEPEKSIPTAFPTTYVGRFSDPVAMALLNSASDVFVNPAIQEAFGQTASEAQACGLPVVAFEDTGIADIVSHGQTGYLAKHGDAEDLANGIVQMFEQTSNEATSNDSSPIGSASRNRAVSHFSYESVGRKYVELYQEVLSAR